MNKEQQQEIGLRLKAIRERAGKTRRELSQKLNVSYAHLNMVEAGRATLSLEKFLEFLRECEVWGFDVEGLKEYYR